MKRSKYSANPTAMVFKLGSAIQQNLGAKHLSSQLRYVFEKDYERGFNNSLRVYQFS